LPRSRSIADDRGKKSAEKGGREANKPCWRLPFNAKTVGKKEKEGKAASIVCASLLARLGEGKGKARKRGEKEVGGSSTTPFSNEGDAKE